MIHNESLSMRLLNFGITTIAIATLIIAVWTFGPYIETRWFPVYSKFSLVKVEKISDTQSKVIFRFTKLRQCEPQGSAWFFGEPGAAFRQIRIIIERPSGVEAVIRPVGTHLTNPYIMDATVEQLANVTFAEIYNRCHPFWLTRSEIYP